MIGPGKMNRMKRPGWGPNPDNDTPGVPRQNPWMGGGGPGSMQQFGQMFQNGQNPYQNLFQNGLPFQQIMQNGPMAGLFGQNGIMGQNGQLAQMFGPEGVIGKRLQNTQFGQQMQQLPPWLGDIPFLGSLFGQPQQPTTQTPLPPDTNQGA